MNRDKIACFLHDKISFSQEMQNKQYSLKLLRRNFTGCERREIWSGVCWTSLHMTLPEPERRYDGTKTTPEKYISFMDLSPLG